MSEVSTELKKICGEESVFETDEVLENYSHDFTEDLSFKPDIVVKPSTAEQISEIMKLANETCYPVVVRGGGTGLSGGALAVKGGIIISMEKFNRILEIDAENFKPLLNPE